jgi:D-alanine-D-alanine ligase
MKKLRVTIVCSTKNGLKKEFAERVGAAENDDEPPPPDFFAEGDDPETINAVRDAISSMGHVVDLREGDINLHKHFLQDRPDIVFNVAEGLFGDLRESFVPMICERMKIPFTGSGPLTLGICLNKSRTKQILSYHGIPVSTFKTFISSKDIDFSGLSFPLMIKPVSEGSSKGVSEDSFVENEVEAKRVAEEKILKYRQAVIAEEFLPGEEFTMAIWGNGKDIQTLPLVSIKFDKLPPQSKQIYSYEAKWLWDTKDNPLEIFECPAKIPLQLQQKMEEMAKRAFLCLDIKDWCRIDFRLDKSGLPNIIEMNPLPGILPRPEENSCFPKAARAAGFSYQEMINKVLEFACKRYGLR